MNSQCQTHFKSGYKKMIVPKKSADQSLSEKEGDQDFGVLLSQIDFIRKLNSAHTPEEFNTQIKEILFNLGFSDYALICKTELNSIETPHSTLPKELFSEYESCRYCRFDMVLDYVQAGKRDPILLSMIEAVIESAPLMTYTFEKNREIFALYRKFNIEDAYVIPVDSQKACDQEGAVFTVMAMDKEHDEFLLLIDRYAPVLKVLADAVCFISETKFSLDSEDQQIKAKPLRLLSTMAKCDLSLAEAAGNLCISLDTANKHMALAKQSLGTSSQANAVYLAVRKGLISL